MLLALSIVILITVLGYEPKSNFAIKEVVSSCRSGGSIIIVVILFQLWWFQLIVVVVV